jgi:hypothetical protein
MPHRQYNNKLPACKTTHPLRCWAHLWLTCDARPA